MAALLLMPEVAADTDEAVLGKWAVAEGSAFSSGAVIAVVETSKAAVDVEADADGVLVRTLVAEGAEVGVGSPIALLAEPDETVDDIDAVLAALAGQAAPPVASKRPAQEPPYQQQRLFASPLARRLARDAGIPAESLRGSGPNNRIVRRDVESAIAARANPPAMTDGHDDYTDVPHTRVRAATAAHLVASKQTAPHFYLRATADVTALVRLRTELNDGPGVRISVNDLVVKAVALAHTRVPEMNVVWTDTAVRRFETVDESIAVATDFGLVTPVVRSVERMTIAELATVTTDLTTRARARSLRQHELEGGSVTVTNLGMFGTEEFAAIINPPQSSILAVGAVRAAVVVREGRPSVGSVMTLTVSVDHRPVDGAVAARWMSELVSLIEKPVQLLR